MEQLIEGLMVSVTTLSVLVAQHVQTPVAYADTPPIIQTVQTNTERARMYAEQYARAYNIPLEPLWHTMTCENKYHDPMLQSGHITKSGAKEDSWGVAQWHLPARNKTEDGQIITKEMAQDMELSIKTMAFYFSKGWQSKWSCYNQLYSPKKE